MSIKFPQITGRQTKGPQPRNSHRQRVETERQRKAAFARQNAAIALKLKGAY